MLEQSHIKESLARITCYKCGKPLEGAAFTLVSEMPVAMVAHVVCAQCRAQSMVTITSVGTGAVPLISDLKGTEVKKFLGLKSVSYDEILDLHKTLKKKSVWNLLQKKGKSLEKKSKKSEKKEKYPQ